MASWGRIDGSRLVGTVPGRHKRIQPQSGGDPISRYRLEILNNQHVINFAWVDAFGRTNPKIVPVEPEGSQFEFYDRASRTCSHSFLFESLTGPQEMAETSVMGFDPRAVVRGYTDRLTVETADGGVREIPTTRPLDEIKKLLRRTDNQSYRYLGGAVGIVNYDAVRLWEDIPQKHEVAEPLMEFGIYDDGILYDNRGRRALYFYYDQNRYDRLGAGGPAPAEFSATEPLPGMDQKEFAGIVNRAKDLIHSGDIFQAVLSRRFSFDTRGDPLAVYRILREMNPSPYLYHLKQGDRTVIGASPEMLVRVTGNVVETFPIAGTRKVTGDEEQDRRLGQELLCDEKELAEHTMLVDLGRNDIGRVCRYGSVHVKDLMAVRRFSHVQHMVTHVAGTLDPQKDMFDAFRAVFPAGTVTGAPKVRAMEIIDELEPGSRGPYAGAVGYFSYNDCCDFAIAIRSVFMQGRRGYVQSGAGIVSDSQSENEFRETEHKAGAMIQALKEASR